MLNAKWIGSSMIALGFSIVSVNAQAADMSISGSPAASVTVGEQYRFLPTVKNADVAHLTFNYQNLPSFSKHYRSSGLILGTPSEPGVYTNVQIGAWDGKHYVLMAPFTITVKAKPGTTTAANGNSAASSASRLTISGTPADEASIGKIYSFSPTVVNGSNSGLTFSIANKPAWAQFSSKTGVLSGTPNTGAAPVDADIVITASNGTQKVSLPAFTIDLSASLASSTTSGTANISWTKPAVNADGSILSNLAGYLVRYGTSPASLNKQITVASAATQAQIDNLPKGTWYFQVASLNSAKVASQFSSPVSTQIL